MAYNPTSYDATRAVHDGEFSLALICPPRREIIILHGVVDTGSGDSGKWISQLQAHHEHKTGILLYLETRNVRLSEPFDLLRKCRRLGAPEYGGTINVNIIPCTIFGKRAAMLRTDNNNSGEGIHPQEVSENATDVCPRDCYSLNDGMS